MPEPESPRSSDRDGDVRTPSSRASDHAAIDRLTEDLLPALLAKLAATGLGEIEVREGGWKVRVRRPADSGTRRSGDRSARGQSGHVGHGHPPAALEGHRSLRAPAGHSSNGAQAGLTAVGPGVDGEDGARQRRSGDSHRAVATSPAVGVFQARAETKTGTRVRAGDRIASVDMLGVPQAVLAPADGIVGASLVDVGDAVEYGQELIVIELATAPAADGATPDASGD